MLYDADVVDLHITGGRFDSVAVRVNELTKTVRSVPSLSHPEVSKRQRRLAAEIWGEAADNFIVRGTPYNTGVPLKRMLDAGAHPVGEARECHAIAVDARAPKFDGGIVTRLDCLPLGIVVNAHAERFYDEGEDMWPKRYAIWGKLIARQPGQVAFSIVDAEECRRLHAVGVSSGRGELDRGTGRIAEVAGGVSPATVEEFNRAVRPGTLDLTTLDDCRTEGLSPNKTHWAQRLDTPPMGVSAPPGHYLHIPGAQSGRAHARGHVGRPSCAQRVRRRRGDGRERAAEGVSRWLRMTIGTVFGRLAGTEAARHAAG